MVKLTEIFNTKYFPAHYEKDLNYFFKLAMECISNPSKQVISEHPGVRAAIAFYRTNSIIEIDIAGARFVPNTIAVVQNYADNGVIVCDTESVTRDAILLENRRRAKVEYEVEPLPILQSLDDLPKYIGALSENIVYSPKGMSVNLSVPLVALITVFRPKVQIDMESEYEKLFQYVNNNVILEEFQYTEYNYVIGSTIYTQKFDGDTIYVQGWGEQTYEEFRKNFLTLPTIFGTKILSQDPAWMVLQNAAIDDLRAYLRNKSTTITDIYPRR